MASIAAFSLNSSTEQPFQSSFATLLYKKLLSSIAELYIVLSEFIIMFEVVSLHCIDKKVINENVTLDESKLSK